MEIRFDSRDERYKKPFGAVRAQETIRFSIVCSEKCDATIIIRNDCSSYNRSFRLAPAGEGQSGFSYAADVRLETPDLYFYRFEVRQADRVYFCGREGSGLRQGDWLPEWQLTVYDGQFITPDWLKGGVMYQIFPDRFKKSARFQAPPAVGDRVLHASWEESPRSPLDMQPYRANDFFGGDFEGIMERLDDLAALGVDALYLNPIFESAENHRYSTADYLKVDPYLGTSDDFARLAEACRRRGIRIILDGVFSHTGADSVYFNRYGHYDSVGAYNSVASPYYDWYKFRCFPDDYACWWGFENLPETNELNGGFRNFIAGERDSVLACWHQRGCGGWRLDVADELPDAFLDQLRQTVKALDSDAVIIGEVWEDASNKNSYGSRRRYLLGRQLDSVMNYPFRTAIIDFVLGGDSGLFQNRVMTILENYPQPAIDTLMNILSTHDTVRIMTQLGAAWEVKREEMRDFRLTDEEYAAGRRRLKMAAFLQFTLPGVPCVYYGDEVGLQGFADPFCRMPYPYGREDTGLLAYYTALAGLRRRYRANFYNGFALLYAGQSVFAYRRGGVSCFVNNSEREAFVTAGGLTEILFAQGEPVLGRDGVTLPPRSYCAVL